jgi:hypothetical protein|tara:strand:+ start:101 stop:277 length:177 start_codon:yes stop_codon:yes gene_type:complete
MKIGDLVKHSRGDNFIGIVTEINIMYINSNWAKVMWCYTNRTEEHKERMHNLRVMSCE